MLIDYLFVMNEWISRFVNVCMHQFSKCDASQFCAQNAIDSSVKGWGCFKGVYQEG